MKQNKTEYKSISKRSKELLKREEDFDVEFKETISALDNDDLVAFANSERGGTIFVGVKETKTKKGRQQVSIKGCNVGDSQKQKILGKAESCVPPVGVHIIVENSGKTPFYRIEIPSGKDKPYATLGGIYKIRGDGRAKALLPGDLLNMFMASEGKKFIERFSSATKQLENEVERTRAKMVEDMKEMSYSLETLAFNTENKLEEIFQTAEQAQTSSEEATAYSDEAAAGISEIGEKIDGIDYMLLRADENLTVLSELLGFDIVVIRRIKLKKKVASFLNSPLLKGKSKKQALQTFHKMYLPDPEMSESLLEELVEECLLESKKKVKGK